MHNVIMISIGNTKVNSFFDPAGQKILKQDKVLISVNDILYYGEAKTNVYQEKKENIGFPLDKVIRKLTAEDKEIIEKNQEEVKIALEDAKNETKKLKLDMVIIDAEFSFDKKQLVFQFTSDNRVDFRELAKKLAKKYKTRIELRQIGVRDKSKKIGGLGPCGLPLCCNKFLLDFNTVSINMAKNQSLALNPTKINGICGRLMCCLAYENETYTNLKKELPKVGEFIETPQGKGKIVSINIFKGTYKVYLDSKELQEFEV